MKRMLFILLAASAIGAASAKGLLPCMVYRRGLTNEQIDFILERHPDAQLRMTAQDWRAMRYQLCRFDCMTNYVELIGGMNDAARVLLSLHDRAETLERATNALAKVAARIEAERDTAAERAREYADAYAETTNRLALLSLDFAAATNRTTIAEAKVARMEAFKAWLVEQRDNARLSTTKAIYQAIIDKIDEKMEGY